MKANPIHLLHISIHLHRNISPFVNHPANFKHSNLEGKKYERGKERTLNDNEKQVYVSIRKNEAKEGFCALASI